MTISLSPDTQRLLEEQMKRHGYSSPDDAVRAALERLDQEGVGFLEDLPAETQAAIDQALSESARGEGRPWADVREEIRDRFIKK